MNIKGVWATKRVYVNGKELSPTESIKLRNHSPDGHNWGYFGSGPSQLSLSLLLINHSTDTALKYYQKLKEDFVAKLPKEDFEIDFDINEWVFLQEELESKKNNPTVRIDDAKHFDLMGHEINVP